MGKYVNAGTMKSEMFMASIDGLENSGTIEVTKAFEFTFREGAEVLFTGTSIVASENGMVINISGDDTMEIKSGATFKIKTVDYDQDEGFEEQTMEVVFSADCDVSYVRLSSEGFSITDIMGQNKNFDFDEHIDYPTLAGVVENSAG